MLDKFVALINEFVAGAISADTFEARYIDLWYASLNDFLGEITPEAKIISDLFLEVDAYSNDPKTVGEGFCISADQLREACRRALAELATLEKEKRQL